VLVENSAVKVGLDLSCKHNIPRFMKCLPEFDIVVRVLRVTGGQNHVQADRLCARTLEVADETGVIRSRPRPFLWERFEGLLGNFHDDDIGGVPDRRIASALTEAQVNERKFRSFQRRERAENILCQEENKRCDEKTDADVREVFTNRF